MNKFKKIFSRYNIIIAIMIVLLSLLVVKLASLTLIQGDYYRELSDTKRVKEIYTTAPRGEIRDRNGKLIAGNKASFTIQILKDELNSQSREERNDIVTNLVRLLEADGADYYSEYPISLNVFDFKEYEELETLNPTEKIISLILENNLTREFISADKIEYKYNENYKFTIIERVLKELRKKEILPPIVFNSNGGDYILEYDKNENIRAWFEDKKLDYYQDSTEFLINYLSKDKNTWRKLLTNSNVRQVTWNLLSRNRLTENIVLRDYSIDYDQDLKAKKKSLMEINDKIRLNTSAEDDFYNLFVDNSMSSFINEVIVDEDKPGDAFSPQVYLAKMLKDNGIKTNLEIKINEANDGFIYKYRNELSLDGEEPEEYLIRLAKENKLLKEFVFDDNIRFEAQVKLLKDGINPRISIASNDRIEYVDKINKEDWLEAMGIKEYDELSELFFKIRDRHKIDRTLSDYEARAVLSFNNLLLKQGDLAFEPINIAYGIKNETVAKMEEGFDNHKGVQVSIEPIRYYPKKELGSHILGYMGRISQKDEIQKYVHEKGYNPNDIVGKTGIEEYYEDILCGKKGKKRIEVDVYGNTTNVIDSENEVPGGNVFLSIDIDLQEYVEDRLKYTMDEISKGGTYKSVWGDFNFDTSKKRKRPYKYANTGATVVRNVKTGEILAMASVPSFNPNLFSTGISDQDWKSLHPENEKDQLAPRPLYNIATQTAIQPGSIFKMLTQLAALEKGLNPELRIRDMGYIDVGLSRFKCWLYNSHGGTHGNENLYDALRDSCNYYFYCLAFGKNPRTNQNIGVTIDIDDIVNTAKKIGFDEKSGIESNIPDEVYGGIPNPERKKSITRKQMHYFLKENINKYVINAENFDEDEVISTILGWVERVEPLSRYEVVKELDRMGLYSEKILEGNKEGLADRIKYTYLNYAGWTMSDMLNTTIGQGQNAYTPLQMANYISVLVNGGYKHKTTFVESIKNHENKLIQKQEIEAERINLNDYENLDKIKKAMLKVTKEGSGNYLFNKLPIDIGSKTGTAENDVINPITGENYDSFAWYVAFAPYDDPEIAISTVIFQGGSGLHATPMTRDIVGEYFGLNNMNKNQEIPISNYLN